MRKGRQKFQSNVRATLLIVSAALLPHASLAAVPERVVSLGGDITEIVYALGAESTLVGVDTTSIWPAQARSLPNVGYVRQLGTEGILALRPKLAIATHDAGPPTVLEQLRSSGVTLESFPVAYTPDAIAAKVRRIGELLERREPANALARNIEAEAKELSGKVAAMPTHPRTVFLLSGASGGLMVSGTDTAADAAVKLAGGHNVVEGYTGYKPLSPEALIALKPDVLLLMNNRGDANGGAAEVLKLPGVAQTPAGKNGRVLLVDGQALLGFGPRTVEKAAELQAELARIPAASGK